MDFFIEWRTGPLVGEAVALRDVLRLLSSFSVLKRCSINMIYLKPFFARRVREPLINSLRYEGKRSFIVLRSSSERHSNSESHSARQVKFLNGFL